MTKNKRIIRAKITLQAPIIICSSDDFSLRDTNIFLNISNVIFHSIVLVGVLIEPAVDVQVIRGFQVVNPFKPKFDKRFVDDIINRRNKNQPDDIFLKLNSMER